jgi:hypothetical protein
VLAFAVYWPALHGPPLFDDSLYIFDNPYIEVPSRENVFALLDPFGYAKIHFVNYARARLRL